MGSLLARSLARWLAGKCACCLPGNELQVAIVARSSQFENKKKAQYKRPNRI